MKYRAKLMAKKEIQKAKLSAVYEQPSIHAVAQKRNHLVGI